MKKILIASISTLVVITACAAVIYHLLAADPQIYYTRIDNTCVKEIDDNDMCYEYTLPAYQRNGEKKDIDFMTDRILREKAFLKLEVKPLRGVISWEEVKRQELPHSAAQFYD